MARRPQVFVVSRITAGVGSSDDGDDLALERPVDEANRNIVEDVATTGVQRRLVELEDGGALRVLGQATALPECLRDLDRRRLVGAGARRCVRDGPPKCKCEARPGCEAVSRAKTRDRALFTRERDGEVDARSRSGVGALLRNEASVRHFDRTTHGAPELRAGFL